MRKDPITLRVCLSLVRVFAAVVPRGSRKEWRAEWESEFRHRHELLTTTHRVDWSSNMDLVRRAFGALPDAAWIRRQFTTDSELLHDVRIGVRMLRTSPAFTLAAVTILALGIGGTVSIATMLDTLMFRPLPYQDAERMVTLWQRPTSGGRDDVAPANFIDWRERSRSFAALAAVIPYSYDFTGTGEPEVFFGAQVTERFLDVMGVTPLIGRGFLPAEHLRGAPKVVMITHGLWQRRFASDPNIANRTITLDGTPFLVVGVLPAEFRPQLLPRPGELAVWTPKVIQDHEKRTRGSAWWNVVGRLAPDVTLEEARAEMAAIARSLAQEHPATNENVGVDVISFREHLMGDVRLPLLVMLTAVAAVLAIGCANVASLLLARGIHREREFAIKAALGAGRARLVRQLVVESLLLSTLAACTGLLIAKWLIAFIVAQAPAQVLRLHDAALDGRMLAFAAALTAATALAFGLLPAIQFSSPRRDVMRARHANAPRANVRRVLVASELAIAIVLLTGAGLLIRSLDRLLAVDPGFSSKNTVALQVFAHDRNPTPEKVRAFFRTTIESIERLPGVDAVGTVSAMPFANANIDIKSTLEVLGRAPRPPAEQRGVYVTVASPGFFGALGVPLREGRLFDERDDERAPIVSVISEALRKREWPHENPLGKRILIRWHGQPLEAEIVGVVNQLRHERLDAAPRPEVFLPLEQVPFASMTYVVRGSGRPSDLIDAARQAVWQADPLQAFYETGSVERMVSASTVRQRFSTMLLSALAGVALLLAAIGIYGVMSVATTQRTREIGVRMALGADRASIRRMVLRDGGRVIATGIVCGFVASILLTRYLQKLLYEVRPIDPVTLATVGVLLSAVALAACYLPARRAMRVDPVVALRVE